MSNVMCILKSIETGDRQAGEELLPLVYDELRQLNSYPEHRDASSRRSQAVFGSKLRRGAAPKRTILNSALSRQTRTNGLGQLPRPSIAYEKR